jgi:hypothetical protein
MGTSVCRAFASGLPVSSASSCASSSRLSSGLGSYCYFNVDPTIHATRAFEVPVAPGVKLHDILSLSITNHGTIDHVGNVVRWIQTELLSC